jgi:hypothetical protein
MIEGSKPHKNQLGDKYPLKRKRMTSISSATWTIILVPNNHHQLMSQKQLGTRTECSGEEVLGNRRNHHRKHRQTSKPQAQAEPEAIPEGRTCTRIQSKSYVPSMKGNKYSCHHAAGGTWSFHLTFTCVLKWQWRSNQMS